MKDSVSVEKNSRTIKNTGIVSAVNALGFAGALAVDMIVAARFGLSVKTDAFFLAYTTPQLITSVALVAFNVVLVPLFSRFLLEKEHERYNQIVSNIANVSTIFFTLIAVVGVLVSPLLTRVIGAGATEETRILASQLSKILFISVIPLGAIEVYKATLNTKREFFFPASTILVRNVVVFVVVAAGSQQFGIYSIAVGYLLAGFIQFFYIYFVLAKREFRYHPIVHFGAPELQEIARQIRYPLLGSLIGQSNILVERFLASYLPVGTVSALGYARRIFAALRNIFANGVSIVFLPRMSIQAAASQMGQYFESVRLAMRVSLLITLPVAAGVIALAPWIIALLFGRGAFGVDSVRLTALLLSIYVASIPFFGVYQIQQVAFYALGDTLTPFRVRLVTLFVNVVLDFLLVWWIGSAGLALALTLGMATTVFLLIWLLHDRVRIQYTAILPYTLKLTIATGAMWILVSFFQSYFDTLTLTTHLLVDSILKVTIGVLLGLIVYSTLVYTMQINEAKLAVGFIQKRLVK